MVPGYSLVQCKKAALPSAVRPVASLASIISWSVANPVEIMRGFSVAAAYSMRGKSEISNDATLKHGQPNDSSKSTPLRSKTEEKIVMPSSLATWYNSLCQHNGVQALL